MAGIQIDGVNNKIDFDDDADTSISSATDDTLVIESGGANIASITAGEFAINEGSADIDFRVESNSNTHMLFVEAGTDRIGINTSSPGSVLQIDGASTPKVTIRSVDGTSASVKLQRANENDVSTDFELKNDGGVFKIISDNASIDERPLVNFESSVLTFNEGGANVDFRVESTVNTHQFFVDADGGTCHIGTTSASPGVSNTTDGIAFNQNGRLFVNAAANTFSQFATDGDGNILSFASAGTGEGVISISGTTTTYGGFTGTHWSRLADNSKPTILRGTLMESLDEMCDWYQAVADIAEVKYTAEDEEVKSGSKNVGDVKEPAYIKRVPITLPDGKAVGDAVTFTFQGETHTGVYEKETDIKHVKSKISDTADSKKIYGLFSHWDPGFDHLDDDVNDMNIAQVGTFIIRVNKDVTVEAGDLLVSNGDGTAKLQDDDIIRSKTVAKVNSNIKVETYEDGSYTVPCTLHC